MNMRRSRTYVLVLTVMLALLGCTTTKDLERRPELIAVEPADSSENDKTDRRGLESTGQAEGMAVTGGEAAGKAGESASAAGAAVRPKADAGVTAIAVDGNQQEPQPSAPIVIEKKIYIEKPIYYPDSAQPQAAKPGESVQGAMSKGVIKPKDYNGAMMLYDYDDILVYQVFTMPLRVTDLYLQPGEKIIEQPFCGDTTRWSIGGGVSKTDGVDTQHLYLKPSEEGLETTLIINTDRRIYHLIIKSFKDTFMLAVKWRYPGQEMPFNFISTGSENQQIDSQAGGQGGTQGENSAAFGLDPAFMSTDYTVSYPKNNPPDWLPTLVVDDGSKTYIILPPSVIHHELPAVFGENGEIVNFRVKDNVIMVDRLMKKIQLKLRNVTVDIKKKGA
jgi:type IV secretion system protein TrbG